MTAFERLLPGCNFDTTRCCIGTGPDGYHAYWLANEPNLDAMVFYLEGALVCGHCGEAVYPQVEEVRDHNFTCEGDVMSWWSRALEVEVHRCGEDVLSPIAELMAELPVGV